MKFKNSLTKSTLALLIIVGVSSCSKDEDSPTPEPIVSQPVALQSVSYDYMFNTGQAAYIGSHANTLSANILLEEQSSGMTKVTITLNNTMSGETYNVHSHDAADPLTTPNGTPYDESPNANVFIQQIVGNGSSVSASQMSTKTFSELTTVYNGFLVVHDPLQAINVTDPTTFVILGSFARKQLSRMTFNYMFNTGQLSPTFAYAGSHPNTLSAEILLEEQPNGMTMVTVTLNNTMNGQTYNVHSHDAEDPLTTPNGTPYDESPNVNVFIQQITGNGSNVSASQMSTKTFLELTTIYDGFLVVHDPLQTINVLDPTTFVILGIFAR